MSNEPQNYYYDKVYRDLAQYGSIVWKDNQQMTPPPSQMYYPPQQMQKETFKVGSKVKITGRSGSNCTQNVGAVIVAVGGTAGNGGVYWTTDCGKGQGACCNVFERDLKLIIKAKDKTRIVDEKMLNKLIISDDARKDLLSVLKQHNYKETIFSKWGLGSTIAYGKGMGMLFLGPPGTGKTFAANLIADSIGQDLLVVSSAEIQSSEPGGAERAIKSVFATAKQKESVLFIDECDSLITTRADVGMILASEINTLLTEIEKFEGVCILATNRIESLDEALERRLSLILEFPIPDYKARKGIWEVLIPKELPLSSDVSSDKLAEHALTGGQIKNVLLRAARLAASAEMKELNLALFEEVIKKNNETSGKMGKERHRRVATTAVYDKVKTDSTIDITKTL